MRGASGRVLLVGWEMAGWEMLNPLLDQGKLPNLKKLVDFGVSGGLSSPPPYFLASQWTTMATGKRAWQHQVCLTFQGSSNGVEPVRADSRFARTIWEILSDQGRRSLVVGWPATHGGSFSGVSVSDRFPIPTAPPGHPWPSASVGTYHPADPASQLDVMRVSPEEIDPETIAHYIPEWKQFDQTRDPILSQLRILLSVDFSYQAAITKLMESEPWSFAAVRFPAIEEICRLFARHHLFADTPSAKSVPMFRDVMPTAYRMLDAMLGRLIEIAGPDTSIILVSPNGISARSVEAFAANDQSWMRPTGIFVASGTGFKQDTLLHGASALDVTPIILRCFGLPPGDDMEGRIPAECFSDPGEIPNCKTWESSGRDSATLAATLRQSLRPADGWTFDWNQAQSLLDAGRVNAALPLLTSLFREFPENPAFSQMLFQAQLSLGLTDDAEQTLEVWQESLPPAAVPLPQAELALARGQMERARQHVSELLKSPAHSLPIWHRIGLLLVALREWEKLEACARTVLKQNEDDEIAWLGLAEASLRRRDFDTAAAAAKRAMGLRFNLPDAHFAFARALVGKGMYIAAIQAIERLLMIDPANELAKNYLRRLRGPTGNLQDSARVDAGGLCLSAKTNPSNRRRLEIRSCKI